MQKTPPHLGSSFKSFLKEEGLYDEAVSQAKKKVLEMKKEQTKKSKAKHKRSSP